MIHSNYTDRYKIFEKLFKKSLITLPFPEAGNNLLFTIIALIISMNKLYFLTLIRHTTSPPTRILKTSFQGNRPHRPELASLVVWDQRCSSGFGHEVDCPSKDTSFPQSLWIDAEELSLQKHEEIQEIVNEIEEDRRGSNVRQYAIDFWIAKRL